MILLLQWIVLMVVYPFWHLMLCLITTIPRCPLSKILSFLPSLDYVHVVYCVQWRHQPYEYVHGIAILTCTQYNANIFYCWPPFHEHSKNRHVPIEFSPFDSIHNSMLLIHLNLFQWKKFKIKEKRHNIFWLVKIDRRWSFKCSGFFSLSKIF